MLDRLDIVVAERAFEAPLRQAHHDPPDARRHRGPAHKRARPLHRPPVQGGRGTRPASEFDAEEVFAACAENNVAVEINSRPERQDPPGRPHPAGPRRRLPVQHRQRRPRPGAARFPAVRRRAGPNATACRRSGSSPPGPWTACWTGPRPGADQPVMASFRGTCPLEAGKVGHSPVMPVHWREDWACPSVRGAAPARPGTPAGHARGTCLPAAGKVGHSPVMPFFLCPFIGVRTGHVPRYRPAGTSAVGDASASLPTATPGRPLTGSSG